MDSEVRVKVETSAVPMSSELSIGVTKILYVPALSGLSGVAKIASIDKVVPLLGVFGGGLVVFRRTF